jgi:hypothetical protein
VAELPIIIAGEAPVAEDEPDSAVEPFCSWNPEVLGFESETEAELKLEPASTVDVVADDDP